MIVCFSEEMVYDDVFSVWETIWAARTISSGHFVLFIALALVELYRDIILENNMDFTDIIKFFNGKIPILVCFNNSLYGTMPSHAFVLDCFEGTFTVFFTPIMLHFRNG